GGRTSKGLTGNKGSLGCTLNDVFAILCEDCAICGIRRQGCGEVGATHPDGADSLLRIRRHDVKLTVFSDQACGVVKAPRLGHHFAKPDSAWALAASDWGITSVRVIVAAAIATAIAATTATAATGERQQER